MFYTKTYLYNPYTCLREAVDVPVRLPHVAIDDMFYDYGFGGPGDPDNIDPNLDIPSYSEHVVTRRARANGVRWERIRGISLYWDGINYTKSKRGEILAILFMDVATQTRRLSAILRIALCCSENKFPIVF